MTNEAYAAVLDQVDQECLEHHGILGMKWGIRRYQNPDGTLTALGKKHLEDGKTQKAIDKWNSQKSNAILKGDDKFVKKNIDYFSNDEIARLKTRVEAKTSINDLEQSARKITEEKLRSWSNMINSVSNAAKNGIDIYNSVAKISNSLFGKNMKQIKDAEDKKDGIEFINTSFDELGRKTTEVKSYTQDGIKRKDTRSFKYDDNKDDSSDNAASKSDSPKPQSPTPSGSSSRPEPSKDNEYRMKMERKPQKVSGTVEDKPSSKESSYSSNKPETGTSIVPASGKYESKSNANSNLPRLEGEVVRKGPGTSIVPSYWGGNPSGNSSKSSGSSSSTGGFKGFKNNMSPNASKAVKDVDDYTDELFKILNGKGYI